LCFFQGQTAGVAFPQARNRISPLIDLPVKIIQNQTHKVNKNPHYYNSGKAKSFCFVKTPEYRRSGKNGKNLTPRLNWFLN